MSSDAERRKSSQEIRTSGLMSSGAGRRSTPGPPARRSRTANAPPIPTCAITVPTAEPSRPQSQPVDEQHLQERVRDLGGGDDDERRPQVADAAQMPLAGEGDEREREPQRGDAQVALGELAGLAAPADERGSSAPRGRCRGPRSPGRSPARARAPAPRAAPARSLLAGAVQPRDLRGRPVGQEDAQPGERREHRRGERERGELRRAEVPDDGGVDEEIQRLGRERPEGGGRKAQDLPVQRAAAHRGEYTMRRCTAGGCCWAAPAWRCSAHAAPGTRCSPPPAPIAPRSSARSHAAPDAVTLADGTSLSSCMRGAATPALLQDLGVTFTRGRREPGGEGGRRPGRGAAARLPHRRRAARRSSGSSGTSAELTHRLERTGVGGRRPGVGRRARARACGRGRRSG